MKLSLILILLSFLPSFSHASLYSCQEPNGNPAPTTARSSKIISFKTTSPYIKSSSNNREVISDKKPFLFYYAVDTAEPFMKFTVLYESAMLIKNCASSQISFVIITNSKYVTKNELTICKNGQLQNINLESYQAFDKKLKEKREYIRQGDHTQQDFGIMDNVVLYESHINETFAKYPLAHPDFLSDFLEFVISEPELFPTYNFLPFINLKGHGSTKSVLSGLHSCQARAKELTQNEIMSYALDMEDITTLRNITNENDIILNLDKIEIALSKLYLGEKGLKSNNHLFTRVDQVGLRNDFGLRNNFGLSSAIMGLGAHEGLGAEYSFGLEQLDLNGVILKNFNTINKRPLGFLLLESCDTQRDPNIFETKTSNTLGYYSAHGSLWYRNINWWELLKLSNNSSNQLFERLRTTTETIPNFLIQE